MFPRPLLDAALEARRLEREEATRQAKVNINKRPGRPGSFRPVPGQQGSGAGACGCAAGVLCIVVLRIVQHWMRSRRGVDGSIRLIARVLLLHLSTVRCSTRCLSGMLFDLLHCWLLQGPAELQAPQQVQQQQPQVASS